MHYPNFHFIPALSDCGEGEEWDGDRGYIADIVSRYMGQMAGMDAYLCGPPIILIETTIKALSEKGVKGSNIYYDEF